jgi:hypothetical protein
MIGRGTKAADVAFGVKIVGSGNAAFKKAAIAIIEV